MDETHQMIQAAIPTRLEKRRIASRLGQLNESTVYKWCEPLTGSGVRNPLDGTEVILEHAALHHPDAAMAIVRHLESIVTDALQARATCLPMAELLVVIQPGTEKELTEAVRAFSSALRQVVLRGDCESKELLREIREAAQALRKAEVMIEAVVEAESDAAK